jgi:two-component system, chemotaxis family, sensor kinase CheA
MESKMTAEQVKGKPPAEAGAASRPRMIGEQYANYMVMEFVNEAMEQVEMAEAALFELETKPDDNEVLNKIFRGFHTIKGMAGFLNRTEIGAIAHAAENVLDLACKGKLLVVSPISDVIFEVIDAKKEMLAILRDCAQASKPVPVYPAARELIAKLKLAAEENLTKSDHLLH